MINQVEAKPGTGMSYDLSFPANCPACKESLHPWLGATGGKCSVCINPHCSAGAEHPRLSPAPAPESQGESVAAPAEVGQVGGTSWIRRSVALRKADSDAIKAIAQAEGCTYEFAMRRLIVEGLAGAALVQFQDHLISQKQALSPIPEMAGKVLAIDSALHELDSYLILKGLM